LKSQRDARLEPGLVEHNLSGATLTVQNPRRHARTRHEGKCEPGVAPNVIADSDLHGSAHYVHTRSLAGAEGHALLRSLARTAQLIRAL
jgi:hypothetical protein